MVVNTQKYKLTLGPCLFNWKVNDWKNFYFKIANETEVDEVYLGEVVCVKRYPFFAVALEDVVQELINNGKKVIFSTFSLILNDLEINTGKKLLELANKYNTMLEVNDISMLNLVGDTPYVLGPTVNVYNELTLTTLQKQGAKRVCFPYEIDKESLQVMAKIDIEKELFVFGRMPLAIAARCYHARIHGTKKDDCKYVCEKDYNGKVISTLVDTNFLTVNGTQTMSYSYNNLLLELPELQQMGINIFRLSPHYLAMPKVIALFKDVLDSKILPHEAYKEVQGLMPMDSVFSNGFYQGLAGQQNTHKVVE
ncbi:U32 family peptidase [Candidatus Hepatincola sp. Av]